MSLFKRLLPLALAAALMMGTTLSCSKEEGPMEEAGKKADEAIEKAEDAVEEASDAVKKSAD
jgi:hypothetical protein